MQQTQKKCTIVCYPHIEIEHLCRVQWPFIQITHKYYSWLINTLIYVVNGFDRVNDKCELYFLMPN